MRSGWLRRLAELPARAVAAVRAAWTWLFANPPSGWPWSWLLIGLLALVVGGSTATASWVPGSDLLGGVALLGVLAGGLLALVRRLHWAIGLPALLAIGVLVAVQRVGFSQAGLSVAAAFSGDANHAGAVFLVLVALLLWAVGAWLAWCVLRWRQPLLGLVPGVATFATNLLNFPADQNAYLLELAGLTLVLLLWSAYRRSLEQAARRGLRLTPDSRWDFWESGAVAAIGLLVVAFFAPPLSTVDRTVDAQSGIIKTWSDVQLRLHHVLPSSSHVPTTLSTGFSDQVSLGHPLTRDQTIVFTYKVQGSHASTLYFQGLSVAATVNGEWRFAPESAAQDLLPPGQVPQYAEDYANREKVTVTVHMLRPPLSAPSVFFYPGQLQSLSRPAVMTVEPPDSSADIVDRAQSFSATTAGSYITSGSYSIATADQLRAAGTNYPDWVGPYTQLDFWGNQANTNPVPYRPNNVEAQIRNLALQVTKGTHTPYDAAAAIENYLRTNFKYTLTPPRTPAAQDPLWFFLFQSKQGYCEYFASAMGDMLRSIGIPVRLVNGYGPGAWDAKSGSFIVRESDAHTWDEVYFPQYGWVPFEPTPDGTYEPVPRGAAQCSANAAICTVAGAIAGVAGDRANAPGFRDTQIAGGDIGAQGSTNRSRFPIQIFPGVLLVPLVLLVIVLVFAIRFLTPRSAARAWTRTQALSRLAGVPPGPGETPLEFGRRLARLLPGGAEAAQAISQAFTRAAYGPPELAPEAVEDVLTSWHSLRPLLLREAAARAARRR